MTRTAEKILGAARSRLRRLTPRQAYFDYLTSHQAVTALEGVELPAFGES